jgi:hypothetical protein
VINDSSGYPSHPNLRVLKDSALWAEGRARMVYSPEFINFAYHRNLCLEHLREHPIPNLWVIFVDCDEVHAPSLASVTRELVPGLPPGLGIVDGYFYQFVQSVKYYVSLDRRRNMMFRWNPELRWEGAVHEKLRNQRGRRLTVPYRYFHYGYVVSVQAILTRWIRYASLGDLNAACRIGRVGEVLEREAARCMVFRGDHPAAALPCIRSQEERAGYQFEKFDSMVTAANPRRISRRLSDFNYDLRMIIQAGTFFLKYGLKPRYRSAIAGMMKK